MTAVVRMPQLAAGGAEAAIQTWLVDVGDVVALGQTIVEIETEKAVVEYEAEAEGTLAGILVAAGDSAPVGAPIAVLAAPGETREEAMREAGAVEEAGAVAAATPDAAPAAAAEARVMADVQPAPSAEASESHSAPVRLFASPLVRRLARDRGIDLTLVAGSGPHGRIVRRDIDELSSAPATPPPAAASAPPASAVPAPSSGVEVGQFTEIPHTGMRRAIARRLTESKSTIPHFYVVADCRVDELLALRARINEQGDVRISVNDLVVKAVAWAMRDVPEANAIWTDDATRRFSSVDIAIAVSVPTGLLTPVVRGVERMTLGELSSAIGELAARAREGRLKQHELEGGSFSVSNLGMYGTREFSAIINPPHAGILAVGAATRRPIVESDGSVGVASIMTVTLSADHRVLDGALAARWLAAFVHRIENPVGMLV
ncbi:pyruvate dehydrogenase complex dihydrolipoamide acetyltransferase [Microbacterium ulmi]|uniref:Acetyltransferase component of pyruvate dehydrogenase complex n=1 Tax=Microbacterium ulmi TaxID=179095 RepID=A0A7Y2Q0U9_9MICO|nr:pyruvate dehydrogenase complex dihydrolipoamide acetyltransferase [Microbacterium ulmi]NII68480.1 pyruvate dehydrogenase E2 component (dihydrolipoamide acetyltransferase) [Microbacterium ulmi]NNH02998.1 pyruvate dehydrogenase complex dihydrolipoamide acetyltransferase [Microbacterium ulmi]